MDQKYNVGDRVKLIHITGSDPAIDLQINSMVGKTGTIVKYYCVTKGDMPDLIKMFVYNDVFSYDVRLDRTGEIQRGIPEPALELLP